jgi:hypothetical protein
MMPAFTPDVIFLFFSGHWQSSLISRISVIRFLKVLLLLLTLLGVGTRASDLHTVVHGLCHEVCDENHEHDDESPSPCHDPQHHHQCVCVQPIFCLPEFPELSITQLIGTRSPQPERCDWDLPDDPVYALDVPPIIG